MKSKFLVCLILFSFSCAKNKTTITLPDSRDQYVGIFKFKVRHYYTYMEADTFRPNGHVVERIVENVRELEQNGKIEKLEDPNKLRVTWGNDTMRYSAFNQDSNRYVSYPYSNITFINNEKDFSVEQDNNLVNYTKHLSKDSIYFQLNSNGIWYISGTKK